MLRIALLVLLFSSAALADGIDSNGCPVKENLHFCTPANENVAKMQCINSQCVGAMTPPGSMQLYQPASDGFIYIPRALIHVDKDRLLKSMKEFP